MVVFEFKTYGKSSQFTAVDIGLDVGLKEYYTDSNGVMVENPKFLKKDEKVLKRCHRRISRKVKGSKNRSSSRQV